MCRSPTRRSTGVQSVQRSREVGGVADLGFVLLTVVEFAVLVLVLRGSERL